LVLVASWFALFGWGLSRPRIASTATTATPPATTATSETSTAATAPTTTASVSKSAKGPWGDLEITPIDIEPPADAADRFATVDTSTWYFRDVTDAATLSQLLQKTPGLTDAQRDALLACARPDTTEKGMTVKPEPSTILSLAPQARAALYAILAANPRNPQCEPFRHRREAGEDWLADTGLPEDILSVVRRLVYRRGDMDAFVDVSVIVPCLKTDAQRETLFRVLASQSGLLVRLRVHARSDLKELTRYWGLNGRERDVGPLLESLSRLDDPRGSVVNVVQLLPPFARSRLYTFPPLEGSSPNGRMDCHWTSFNFWSTTTPDDQYSTPGYVSKQATEAYHPIPKLEQLGDLIFLINARGEGIHSAIYIADDIVFTKNGSSMAAPWIFMRLKDLTTYYETNGAVKTMFFRKNGVF